MMRRLVVASVVLTAACAGQQKTDGKEGQGKPTTVEERQRITNQPPFDLGTCFPRQDALPSPANEGVAVGALLGARPEVLECLVDPANRGPAESTKVTVKTTITEQGVTNAITGENLTPTGQQCIQQIVDSHLKGATLAAGAKPVEASYVYEHSKANNATVTFGINEGSDFSGNVRMAQKAWCECFAPYKETTPAVLTAKVKLMKGQANATDITFEPSGSTEGDQLAACLKGKMATLPAKLSVNELTFPYRFVTFNSQAPASAAAALPSELRFFQLELARTQAAATSALAFGARSSAAEAFDAVVQKYTKTKDYKLFDELSSKCSALVESATKWVDAIKAQEAVDQATVTLIPELKAKDASWAEVETASQQALANTQKDRTAAEARLDADKKACPKKSYKQK